MLAYLVGEHKTSQTALRNINNQIRKTKDWRQSLPQCDVTRADYILTAVVQTRRNPPYRAVSPWVHPRHVCDLHIKPFFFTHRLAVRRTQCPRWFFILKMYVEALCSQTTRQGILVVRRTTAVRLEINRRNAEAYGIRKADRLTQIRQRRRPTDRKKRRKNLYQVLIDVQPAQLVFYI